MIRLLYNNTDKERLEILKAFNSFVKLEISEECSQDVLGHDTEAKIEYYYNIFEKLEVLEVFNKQKEIEENKEYESLYEKALIFVTHYYLVMFMAIERGELQDDVASYYGFSSPLSVPIISNEEELLAVSQKLFESDSNRINAGGRFITNPSIGAVKVWVEKFKEVYDKKNNIYNANIACVENIALYRQEVDKLVFWIFNFLTKRFADSPSSELVGLFKDFEINISLDLSDLEEAETNSLEYDSQDDNACTNEVVEDEIILSCQLSTEESSQYCEKLDVLNSSREISNPIEEIISDENPKPSKQKNRKSNLVDQKQLEFDLFF